MAGMLTLKKLQQAVSAGEIDTVEIDVVASRECRRGIQHSRVAVSFHQWDQANPDCSARQSPSVVCLRTFQAHDHLSALCQKQTYMGTVCGWQASLLVRQIVRSGSMRNSRNER
jgi:hypothetical protein